MCEPPILARTGLTVTEHQARTVASYLLPAYTQVEAEQADDEDGDEGVVSDLLPAG